MLTQGCKGEMTISGIYSKIFWPEKGCIDEASMKLQNVGNGGSLYYFPYYRNV